MISWIPRPVSQGQLKQWAVLALQTDGRWELLRKATVPAFIPLQRRWERVCHRSIGEALPAHVQHQKWCLNLMYAATSLQYGTNGEQIRTCAKSKKKKRDGNLWVRLTFLKYSFILRSDSVLLIFWKICFKLLPKRKIFNWNGEQFYLVSK